MRTTLTLDDDTVREAARLTGEERTSRLVNDALQRLVRAEKARRLAALGGTEPEAGPVPRRRSKG